MIKLKQLVEMEDYHHSMDYDEDFRPPQKVIDAINGILKQTKKLQDALGFKTVRIGYIVRDRNDALARYIAGSMDNPYFVISGRTLLKAAKKYQMNLWTAVETTLVHEFGHAYLEMCGIDTSVHDEDVVEEFAREYNDFYDIADAKKVLDDFVSRNEPLQEIRSPYPSATSSDTRRGYIGSIYGRVIGYDEMVPDVMQVDHSELPGGRNGSRFRYFVSSPKNTVMWNEFPPTESDKHKVDDWLAKKGIHSPNHVGYREYLYLTTGKWE